MKLGIIFSGMLLMLGLAVTAGAVVFLVTAGEEVWAMPEAGVGMNSMYIQTAARDCN
ncbi:MAG: hypothetical protein HYS18_13020 [Burkholderiales bacterium]|nr:hypothetical protein [Burkholderiales bacterium]